MMGSKQYQVGFGRLFTRWCLILVLGAKALLVVDNTVAADATGARTTIEDVRMYQSPERTRVVFDLNNPVEHSFFTLSGPRRFVIDVQNADFKANIDALALAGTPISELRYSARNGSNLRIVFVLNQPVKPKSFTLKPIFPHGNRLVIDLYNRDDAQLTPVIQQSAPCTAQKRDIVIVVDAGHGGDDPGAVGKGNLYEKDVALAIAKKTAEYFEKETGYKVILTRKDDYYLSLEERVSIAREHVADVFISIHADAFKAASASGASVYVISQRNASKEAKRLAEKENRADLIGGVSSARPDYGDGGLAVTLEDLCLTGSLDMSLEIGKGVLKAIKPFNKLHRQNVERAAFLVLKARKIPSLLVETGYISNPAEAKKLNSKRYQAKMARAIFVGVHQYMLRHPPVGSLLASNKQKGMGEMLSHQVESGDTLSEIAEKYQISSRKIMRLNDLNNANIKIGQVLKIPRG